MSANTSVLRNPARPAVRNRVLAAGGAVVAAVAVWFVEVPVLGLNLATQFGNAAPVTVGFWAVLVSSLAGSLAGWAALAVLEWRTSRGMAIWTSLAVAALFASLALPLAAGTTMAAKLGLVLMHLAVGSVLIPGLRRI